jgi:uncharacterized protein
MDLECGKAAIDLFLFLGSGAKSIEYIFTGGEPLLNFDVFKILVIYANEKSIENSIVPSFIIKSNGTLFNDSIINFCKDYNVRVVLSIDGLPKFHDKYRVSFDGLPTQAIVAKTSEHLFDSNIDLSASLTVHPDNASGIIENVEYLHALGFDEIDIAPAYGTVHWTNSEIECFENSLELCALFIKKNKNNKSIEISPLNRNSEHINEFLKNNWGCKAGVTNLAFMPNGDIVGCSSLVMLTRKYPNLIIGNVKSGVEETALDNLFELTQAPEERRQSCKKCQSKDNCSGGCLAINLSSNQEPLTPPQFYCNIISKIPVEWENAWGENE